MFLHFEKITIVNDSVDNFANVVRLVRRVRYHSVEGFICSVRWIDRWNDNPTPFAWTKTADEILERRAAYLDRIPGAGH